ncbi:hypothetical protein [Reichenbachiella ulvae]|uniref:NIPSNAP protein n=1 Tax=Reichenbachiella ulvae TaxID=2980104 RepID=A0ABT3D0Q6_9BACT|nr:hypothetical protein [Reichenbachiella ulvae]MCV9389401.1 hypothetical protein [Reichenbachiella ulvae]
MNYFKLSLLGLVGLVLFFPAQSQLITISTAHWSADTTGSIEGWYEVETEIHEKTVVPNEKITGAWTLYHYYTDDNSEILFVNMYEDWNAIDEAGKIGGELAEKAWKKEEDRQALGKKRSKYYSTMHSDEIYSALPNAKPLAQKPDSGLIVYMQKFRIARTPEGGSTDEIMKLSEEFDKNVIHKNDMILGYYPMRHFYGADSRDLIKVYILKSLADVEKMADKNRELVMAYWPDEEKRKAFFKKYNAYTESWHGDAIYSMEAKLYK